MDQEQVVDALRDWLDGDDWRYEYDAVEHLIRTGVTLDCKLRNARVFIPIRGDGSYVVNIVSPINGDPNNIGELARYIAMVNYGLANGNFDLDVKDGEVRYKVYVGCETFEKLSAELIKDSIYVGWFMMEHYGDGLAALAMGFSDAETEYEKARRPKNEEA